MGWSLLFMNSKIFLLLILLIFFIGIAVLIIFIDTKLKKRTRIGFVRAVEDTRIKLLKKELIKATSKEKKLAVINRHAKYLFKERLNMGTQQSYSELVGFFKRRKLYQYASFCEKMFEVYYSDDEVNDEKLKDVLSRLIQLIRERNTYLDPAKYSVESLYPKEQEIANVYQPKVEEQKTIDVSKIEKSKELVERQKYSIVEKQRLLRERKRMIDKREKELDKKERQNKRLLKEIEDKLTEQERKIKEQERIQRELSIKYKHAEEQEEKLVEEQKKKEDLEYKEKEEIIKKHWRKKIETRPLTGREYIEMRKGRRTKNR